MVSFNSFLLCILLLFVSINSTQFRFDYNYEHGVEGWFKLHRVPANWHDANLRCQLEGSILASPINERMITAMRTLLSTNGVSTCGVFTGIHATFSRGDYVSIEGVPLSRIPVRWAPDEPDNYEDQENCLIFLRNGTMADVKCTDVYPYFCFKKKTKNMIYTGCGTIDSQYTLDIRTGNCYKFHRVPRTWPRAYMTCLAEGGHLAIINSDTEAQIIKDLFAKNPANTIPGNFYKDVGHIGFNDWGEPGSWWTIHGETLEEAGYAKWGNGQPDNNTARNIHGSSCGGIFRNGLLDDIWCNAQQIFICEKSPDSLLVDDAK